MKRETSSMIGLRCFAIVSLGGAMLALGGCGRADNVRSAEVRYQMTVEVETPEGVKSGSSVWSRSIRKSIGPISPYNSGFQAEAVAVELPGGRTLFALVKGQEFTVDRVFPEYVVDSPGEDDRIAHIQRIAENVGVKKALPCIKDAVDAWPREANMGPLTYDTYCPRLVTFRDQTDPMSVESVNPDELAGAFGRGYRLKAITLQVTDEPVTKGIEKRLGWLSKYPEPRLDPDYKGSINPSLSQLLSHGDFKWSQ